MIGKCSIKFLLMLCLICVKVIAICDRFEKCSCDEKIEKHFYALDCPSKEEDGVNIVVARDMITVTCNTDDDEFQELIPDNLTGIIHDAFKIKRLSIEQCRIPAAVYAQTYVNRLGIVGLHELRISSADSIDTRTGLLEDLTNLTVLELEYLNVLNIAMFNNLTQLQKLTLKGNNIDGLEGLNLPTLLTLKVRENNLKSLRKTHFSGLVSLMELEISDSGTSDIEQDTFVAQKNLVKIEIHSTKMNSLFNNMFNGSEKLEEVSIFNKLRNTSYISGEMLNGVTSLKKVTISCGLNSIPGLIFSTNYQLTSVNLANNHLKQLNAKLLSNLKELKHLKLNGNDVELIPEKFFDNNSKLQLIDLSGNKLKRLTS